MKKILSCMGALLALCLTFSVSAQTLLYDAASSGTTFAKVGGTQDYTLNLNGNVVVDGKIVMTAAQKAVDITSPDLANVTVVMLVSNINTAIEGQFMTIGRVGLRTVLPTIPATTGGGVKGTFNENVWGNVGTVNLPTNLSTTTVTYAYSKASGSTSYINGAQSFDASGLKDATYTTANILLGGKSKTTSDNLNVGMLIHRVQIYEAKLNATQVATAEATIKAAIETPDAPLFTPVVPVADNGKWYFVKSQRSAGADGVSSAMNVPNWWTVQEDGKVIPNAMTQAENQQFQVVTASDGKVTFNVKDGGKTMSLQAEYSDCLFTGTEKVTEGWTITPKTINGVQGVNFPGQGGGIHQSAKDRGFPLMGWYGENDYCTFFFYEETPDFSLRFAIEDARALVGTAFVGTDLGCVPQEAIDTYKVAIKAAEALLGNADAEAIATATTALTAATTAFRAAKVALNTSTDEPTYYYIVSKNTEHNYSLGQVIYTTGAATQCMWGPKTTPTLNMLFRFEKHGTNNTYRIINAAFSDGNLVGVNNGTDPTYWAIEELTGGNDPQFRITGNGTLHAQRDGNTVVDWGGGYGSASAWTFAPVEGGIASIFQAQYDALVTEYAAMVDDDGNATSAYPLGTAVGQYNETMFGTMKTAYAAMVTDMDGDGATLTATIGATTTAIAAFKASQVQPYAFNGTIDPTGRYTLKYVNPNSEKTGFYLTNPRTELVEGHRPKATLSNEYDATTCDWWFQASTTQNKYLILSNRIEKTEDNKREYLDEEGRVRSTESFGDNGWTTKTLLQSEETWSKNTSYLVIKIDHNSDYFFVNENDVFGRNSKDCSFFKLELMTAVSVDEATQSVRATVVNGTIEVGGAQTIDVYTITGLQVENKNLKPGVYVAKANGVTYKVAVK